MKSQMTADQAYGEITTDIPLFTAGTPTPTSGSDLTFVGAIDDFLSNFINDPNTQINTVANQTSTNNLIPSNNNELNNLFVGEFETLNNSSYLNNQTITSDLMDSNFIGTNFFFETSPLPILPSEQQQQHNDNNIVQSINLITNNQKHPKGIIQDNVNIFFGSHGSSDQYWITIKVSSFIDQLLLNKQNKLIVQVKREQSKEILKKAKWIITNKERQEDCTYVIHQNNFPKTRRGKTNEPCVFCFQLENSNQEQVFEAFRFQFYSKSTGNNSIVTSSNQVDSSSTNLVGNDVIISNVMNTNSPNSRVATPSSTNTVVSNKNVMDNSRNITIPHNNSLFSFNNNQFSTFQSLLNNAPLNNSLNNNLSIEKKNQSFDQTSSSNNNSANNSQDNTFGKKRKKIEIFEPKLYSIAPVFGPIGCTVVLLGNFNVLNEKSVKVMFDHAPVLYPHSVTPNAIICQAPEHEEGNAHVHVIEEFEHFEMKTESKVFRYISESFQQGINQLVFNAGPRPYMPPPNYGNPTNNNRYNNYGNTSSGSSSGGSNDGSNNSFFFDSLRQNNLHRAAYEGDVMQVTFLLFNSVYDPLELDNFKRHAFHIACARGQVEIAQLLWTNVVENENFDEEEDEESLSFILLYQKDSFGQTAFGLADKLLPDCHSMKYWLLEKMEQYPFDFERKLSTTELYEMLDERDFKLKKLSSFFPSVDNEKILNALERCSWNEMDAASTLLCEQFENNIYNKSTISTKEAFMVIEKQKALNQIIDFINSNTSFSNIFSNRLMQRFNYFEPEQYFNDFENEIKRKFSRKIHKIENIVHPNLQLRFSQYIAQDENPLIFMTFHGTSEHNISSIKKHGLLVPGKGNSIRQVNKCEYGLGIYLSFNGSSSIEYCYGGSKMFVCAVCIRDKIVVSEDGNVLVVFDERSVLPCWLVTFENRHENIESPVSFNFNNNLLKQI
ncbi:hypothetical protein ABK040_004857 [Willaertia magna]